MPSWLSGLIQVLLDAVLQFLKNQNHSKDDKLKVAHELNAMHLKISEALKEVK